MGEASLPFKCGLHIVNSFPKVQYGRWGKTSTVEKADKQHFNQVIKVNINSDGSC